MHIISKTPLIFKSEENIDEIKSNLNPLIIKCWIEDKPYLHYKHGKNIGLNYDNPFIKENSLKLYDFFLNRVSSIFKNYTINETNSNKVFSYISDKNYTESNWHNHIRTASINGVFYLKCVEDRGIYFRENGNQIYIQPKENELYIFAGNLDHLPIPSTNDNIRISCNVELKCNESIKELFDLNNIKDFLCES